MSILCQEQIAQVSKEKQQSIITLRHEGQSMWTFPQLWKFLQVRSQILSSAMMKLALTRTGKEDPELPLLQKIRSLELTAPQIAAQINASQISSNRHISTSTVQRRLHESGLHGQIAAKKPLLKGTINNKRLAWAKKHEQWTLYRWKSVLWSDEAKCEIFWFQPRCLCETQSRWTDDLCMCDFHREAWKRCDGVGVLCWWHRLWFI